jgi:hypothetical protein
VARSAARARSSWVIRYEIDSVSRSIARRVAFVGGNVPPFHELAQCAQEFLGGQLKASVGRKGAQNVCDLMAASVRFFAFNFFIIRRTWTLTVVSHMPSS